VFSTSSTSDIAAPPNAPAAMPAQIEWEPRAAT
jgi:hypothetical protein